MKNKKLRLLQLKPLTLRDVCFARLLKPFEDSQLVSQVPHSALFELQLIHQAICENNLARFYGASCESIRPSVVFENIHRRTAACPILIECYQDAAGNYSQFRALKVHQDLQSLIAFASSRAYFKPNISLPKFPHGNDIDLEV